jgi:hypothetical protein
MAAAISVAAKAFINGLPLESERIGNSGGNIAAEMRDGAGLRGSDHLVHI